MNARLQALQALWARFMARPARERALLLGGVLALTLLLADRVWTAPAWAERQAARQQAAAAAQALTELRQGLAQQQQQAQAEQQARAAERAVLQQQLAELQARAPTALSGERALLLLERLVERQQGGVQIVALTALPAPIEPVASAASAASGTSAGGPRLYRHGLQLVLQGRYAALHAYLLGVAQEPLLQVRGFQLAVREHPELELTLLIETPSPQAAWLTL